MTQANQLTGVVIALSAEARCLTGESIPVDKPYRLKNLLIYVCGMGAENASRATEHLLQAGCLRLISWGTAGALQVERRPGDLILPDRVTTSCGQSYATDPAWRAELILQLACSSHTGSLLSTHEVLNSSEQKRLAQQHTQAIAVDMESAAVARLANQHNTPLLVIRAVVDSCDMSIPGFTLETVDAYGRSKFLSTLLAVARHPASIASLIRLGKAFSLALQTLSSVAPLIKQDEVSHASV